MPNTPSVMTPAVIPLAATPLRGITSAVRARIPPSPWLSARITSARYLIEMMMISAQNTTDATPNAVDWSTVSSEWSNASRNA